MPAVGASAAAGYASANAATTGGVTTQASTGLCVFAQWQDSAGPPVITDNQGNSFGAPLVTLAPSGGSFSNWIGAWVLPSASGGSGHTVTATKTNGYPTVFLVEVTDADAYTHASAIAAGSPFNSGSVSPAADALLVGFAAYEGTGVTSTTVSAGFTKAAEITSFDFWQGVAATRGVSAGTYDFEATVTNGADGGAILIALTGAGEPPPPGPEFRPGVLRVRQGGQWVAGDTRGRVGAAWVPAQPKGYTT